MLAPDSSLTCIALFLLNKHKVLQQALTCSCLWGGACQHRGTQSMIGIILGLEIKNHQAELDVLMLMVE